MKNKLKLLSLIPAYISWRYLTFPKLLPMNYTLSITYRCNSRCKTCYIWKIQRKIPFSMELNTEEWRKIVMSLGDWPFWITISGGEPFLRQDIVDIIHFIDKYNNPAIINIPTNGILYDKIPKTVEEILNTINRKTELIINFSMDGIGKVHDYIRGVPGNFQRLMKSYLAVYKLKKRYPNLTVGLHSVVSVFSIATIVKTADFIYNVLKPDQYITEIAEERNEMENIGSGITPSPEEYAIAITKIQKLMIANTKPGISLITYAFRYEYYNIVKKLMLYKKQIIPSYAGFASTQISPIGDVWECAVYATKLGNLREFNYNFPKLWFSKKAEEIRKAVKKKHVCPLANENYTNMLLHPPTLFKILIRFLKLTKAIKSRNRKL